MILKAQRKKIINIALMVKKERLIPLTFGNFSLRDKNTGYICITPSGMDYEILKPRDIIVCSTEGEIIEGIRKPSIETPMHCLVYKHRKDVMGIIHTHSVYASAWASCGNGKIPIVSVELAALTGRSLNCADYAKGGTNELAQNVVKALGDNNGVLLKNHGLLTVGSDIESAFSNAVVVEEGAKVAYIARQIGNMNIIHDKECDELHEGTMKYYGQ